MSTVKMTVAQAMTACLQKEGVSLLFGYPGAAICPFYDALSKTDLRHILVRQEQNAGHAASGYARISGKPGVCVATSGPGALNLITAVATAYMDSVPLVVLTGQVASDMLGRDVFQEADITGAAEPFVKHSYLVKNAADIPRIFKEAFHIATTGRQGPVLIDIPVDIQKEEIEFSYPDTISIRSYKPSVQGHAGQVKRVAAALAKAKRPLICAGGGVFAANTQLASNSQLASDVSLALDACETLLALATKANIPLVTTMMGLSAIPPACPLNLGMIGMYGAPRANQAMNKADLLILIGARVGDRAIMSPLGLSKNTTIVHIDVDPAEIGKNIPTDIPLVGDAKAILLQLAARMDGVSFADWTSVIPTPITLPSTCSNAIEPAKVITSLCKKAQEDAVLVADVGQNQIWAAKGYAIPKGRFLTSGGMGTMGYALPAAVGVSLAQEGRQIIAVCGDGGFQMSMMELATISQYKLDVKILLLNNSCLGMIRELQDLQYGGNQTAVDLAGNPDFVALAKAYSIPAKRICSKEEIDSEIAQFLSCKGAFLLECVINPSASAFG